MPSRSLDDLHPTVAEKARQLIELCKAEDIELRITSTLRTFAEQADLYAQGRTKPGQIVTRAKPGQSWHQFGLAFDCCPFYRGKPVWNSRHWDQIGQLGKKLGLIWGGMWLKPDKPHFEYHPKLTLAQAAQRHAQGKSLIA
jgi:peptidoglycan L-alanyl-D-glutamate endopeptidase CwlK